jgi:DNA-3-methyladenine glycosylase II
MRISLTKPEGFSLAAAASFYESFVPGSGMAAADVSGTLALAFRLDRSFDAVVVSLEERGRTIVLDVAGTEDEALVKSQLKRMLGLDVDGEAWRSVRERDPVVGRVQAEFPGFFTAAKSSPYDAATWAMIATRLPMGVAAKIKMQIARDYGDAVTIGRRVHHVFPTPSALLRVEKVPGLADEKIERLHEVARAALDGRLAPDRLLAMGPTAALADLQRLRGVGPWTASHIFYRGAAPVDELPTIEPRVLAGWGDAAGVATPTEEAFVRASEAWRPFRTWVAILFARHLARSGGWNRPGLARARAKAIARASAASSANLTSTAGRRGLRR